MADNLTGNFGRAAENFSPGEARAWKGGHELEIGIISNPTRGQKLERLNLDRICCVLRQFVVGKDIGAATRRHRYSIGSVRGSGVVIRIIGAIFDARFAQSYCCLS